MKNQPGFTVLTHYVDQGHGHGHNRISAFRGEREVGHIAFNTKDELQIIANAANKLLEQLEQPMTNKEQRYYLAEDELTIKDRQVFCHGDGPIFSDDSLCRFENKGRAKHVLTLLNSTERGEADHSELPCKQRIKSLATRQFRHNNDNSPSLTDPKGGFVIAYDAEIIDAALDQLYAALKNTSKPTLGPTDDYREACDEVYTGFNPLIEALGMDADSFDGDEAEAYLIGKGLKTIAEALGPLGLKWDSDTHTFNKPTGEGDVAKLTLAAVAYLKSWDQVDLENCDARATITTERELNEALQPFLNPSPASHSEQGRKRCIKCGPVSPNECYMAIGNVERHNHPCDGQILSEQPLSELPESEDSIVVFGGEIQSEQENEA
jgi:hypothetical protein